MELKSYDIRSTASQTIGQCKDLTIKVIRAIAVDMKWTWVSSGKQVACDVCDIPIIGRYRSYCYEGDRIQLCDRCTTLTDHFHGTCSSRTHIGGFREQIKQDRTRAHDVIAHMRVAGLISDYHKLLHIDTACATCNGSLDDGTGYTWRNNITPWIHHYHEVCERCHLTVCARTQQLYTYSRVLLIVALMTPLPMDIRLYICGYIRELIIQHATNVVCLILPQNSDAFFFHI